MKTYASIFALTIAASAFGQNPNQNPNQPPGQPRQPGQVQPATPSRDPAPTVPSTSSQPAENRVTQGLSNIFTDWRLEELPPAVQQTIRQQAGAQKIADIDREDRTGQTIWEVEFEREGRNTEIHVSDDGTLQPEGRNTGRAAGAVTGTSREPNPTDTTGRSPNTTRLTDLGTKWEDLPQAVQQKAMQYGGKQKVADIDREDKDGKTVYEIEFQRQGRNLEVYFAQDGSVVKSNDPNAAPAQGSPAPGEKGILTTPPPPTTPQDQSSRTPNNPNNPNQNNPPATPIP